mmetsp:Transcript_26874/g.67666  ORF Transcript_26874/g.67666 Transcript_26874/m.67666 type:complete len:318 (+) Transcript_26874:3401-4354(+)
MGCGSIETNCCGGSFPATLLKRLMPSRSFSFTLPLFSWNTFASALIFCALGGMMGRTVSSCLGLNSNGCEILLITFDIISSMDAAGCGSSFAGAKKLKVFGSSGGSRGPCVPRPLPRSVVFKPPGPALLDRDLFPPPTPPAHVKSTAIPSCVGKNGAAAPAAKIIGCVAGSGSAPATCATDLSLAVSGAAAVLEKPDPAPPGSASSGLPCSCSGGNLSMPRLAEGRMSPCCAIGPTAAACWGGVATGWTCWNLTAFCCCCWCSCAAYAACIPAKRFGACSCPGGGVVPGTTTRGPSIGKNCGNGECAFCLASSAGAP